jgi:hypothetical protein
MNPTLDPRVDQLAEDSYEHFLRESVTCVTEGEWYEMALAVAGRFRDLIVAAKGRNMV